jgi:hypothetical protein
MAVHGGYTEHIVGRVSSLVAVCTRRVSRATRRLLRHRHRYGVSSGASSTASYRRRTRPVGSDSFFTRPREQQAGGGKGDDGMEIKDVEGDGEGVVWRRAILMGERCQPLDFAGAIHYDSFGRRLARPPTGQRSASSLSCRSSGSLAAYLETTEV